MFGNYTRRTRGLYDSSSSEPFVISRSKIDLFKNCQRCFYLDQRLGIKRPDSFPFTLNNAVDLLLKKEFDIHRSHKSVHPLLKQYGVDAVPFQHEELELWRDALRHGVKYLHKPTNFLVRGGIDDVWVDKDGKLIVVDYKATSKDTEVTIDADWQDAYKRQVEVYQWLFRQNGFRVSPIAYFVYVNAKRDREAFEGKLEFDVNLIPYEGDDSWIPGILSDIKKCLNSDSIPAASQSCDYCAYRREARVMEN